MTETKLSDAERCEKLARWLEPKTVFGLLTDTAYPYSDGQLWQRCESSMDRCEPRDFPNDPAASLALKRAFVLKTGYDVDVCSSRKEEAVRYVVVISATVWVRIESDYIDDEPRAVFEAIWAAYEQEVSDGSH